MMESFEENCLKSTSNSFPQHTQKRRGKRKEMPQPPLFFFFGGWEGGRGSALAYSKVGLDEDAMFSIIGLMLLPGLTPELKT